MSVPKLLVRLASMVCLCGGLLPAEEQVPPVAYIDPAKVDADFAVQGEYVGELTIEGQQQKVGVQVVAQGDGAFLTVGYVGGLPGDGWDGSTKHEGKAKTENGVTKVESDKVQASIKDGVLTINDLNGNKLGDLKRTTRKSPTLEAKPPAGAVVLFAGTDANGFPTAQVTPEGLLKQGALSEKKFQSGTLHLEFLLSYMPKGRGQGRANSGVYLQGRYEVQILDSFGLKGDNHECGGVYEISDPSVNMCFPPLSWQTYDIEFTAAKFDADGKKTADAKMTVKHNGVVIQKDLAVPFATRAAPNKEGTDAGPIYLQDHGNPIRYRNIWFVEQK